MADKDLLSHNRKLFVLFFVVGSVSSLGVSGTFLLLRVVLEGTADRDLLRFRRLLVALLVSGVNAGNLGNFILYGVAQQKYQYCRL